MKFRDVFLFATVAVAAVSGCAGGVTDDDDQGAADEEAGGAGGELAMGGRSSTTASGGSAGGGGDIGESGGGGDNNNAGGAPVTKPSPDAGSSQQGGMGGAAMSDAGAPGDKDPPGLVPAIVGVGYAGVKIRSLDNGLTWKDRTQLADRGGDDPNLLRAVAYGKGLWVAGGWKYLTSRDAVTWTEQTVHPCGGGVLDGLAFGNDIFVGACGGDTYVSSDGLTWKRAGRFSSGGHPKVVFGNGMFAAFGDSRQAFRSADAMTWTRWEGMRDAAFCSGELKSREACKVAENGLWTNGVWVRGYTPALGGGGIFRSTDGTTYTRASQTNVETFAAGFVP